MVIMIAPDNSIEKKSARFSLPLSLSSLWHSGRCRFKCVFKLHESGTAYLVLKLCSSSMTIDNISRVHSMNERAVQYLLDRTT